MKEKSFLSIIIYVYNQAEIISNKLLKLDHFLFNNFENYELIIVNNSSNDNTEKSLENIKQKIKKSATIINLDKKQNIETAILAGTEFAIGDYILEIENLNAEFKPALILQLFKKCTSGFDLVTAQTKNCERNSRIFYQLFNKVNNLKVNLNSEALLIITRRALNQALRSKEKNKYRKILYLNTGFPYTTIDYNSKTKIKSNKTLKEKINLAIEMFLLFSNVGLNFTFILSILFFIFSIVIGIYAMFIFFTYKQVISGWTTTMLFLSFGFSGIFLLIGILIKLLNLVLQETKDKPQYTIRSIKKIESSLN